MKAEIQKNKTSESNKGKKSEVSNINEEKTKAEPNLINKNNDLKRIAEQILREINADIAKADQIINTNDDPNPANAQALRDINNINSEKTKTEQEADQIINKNDDPKRAIEEALEEVLEEVSREIGTNYFPENLPLQISDCCTKHIKLMEKAIDDTLNLDSNAKESLKKHLKGVFEFEACKEGKGTTLKKYLDYLQFHLQSSRETIKWDFSGVNGQKLIKQIEEDVSNFVRQPLQDILDQTEIEKKYACRLNLYSRDLSKELPLCESLVEDDKKQIVKPLADFEKEIEIIIASYLVPIVEKITQSFYTKVALNKSKMAPQ